MDVVIKSYNNLCYDRAYEQLINGLHKVLRLMIIIDCLVSDCIGLSKWIFMPPTSQTNFERLLMSRRSGSCLVSIVSKGVLSVWYKQKNSVLLCGVTDVWTTLNEVCVKSKLDLNVMLESKLELHIAAISPPGNCD